MSIDILPSRNPFLTREGGKVPAHQHVYDQLREMILFGDLAPGQAVTIQGLTTQMNAGMTPVREALRRLIAEGALMHQGNRRVSVPVLTPEGANELGFMRKTLEPELARRAVSKISPEVLEALEERDKALNHAIDHGDVNGYLTHNYQFHTLIYHTASAPIMAATVDRLWLRFGPSLRVVCGRFGTQNLPDKHADLLAALRQKDCDRAAMAMTGDVEQGIRHIQAALQEQAEPSDSIDSE
jgi:DNA-binding GntR family transcriptional regulator